MSVYKNRRNESTVQFLETAHEIQVFTIRQLIKIPNKFKYFLAGDLSGLASKGHILLKEANSIFPKDRISADERKRRLIEAYAAYQALVSQIGVAEEFAEFPDTTMTTWMTMISEELSLIKKLMLSDEERYKALS